MINTRYFIAARSYGIHQLKRFISTAFYSALNANFQAISIAFRFYIRFFASQLFALAEHKLRQSFRDGLLAPRTHLGVKIT
ncbi:hypothetical protein VC218_13855 [Xanthomonas nasturtii]|uniref:hypothetical protein n=1 Tax=Xanthomonas nasturtii TaxID=1843581 RepID=UPI002B23C57E|nr:hypothetical protein [Xanthomonas nasturtii]MEA9579943.1 hypothetical protein [Xanthomonas nasturtii]